MMLAPVAQDHRADQRRYQRAHKRTLELDDQAGSVSTSTGNWVRQTAAFEHERLGADGHRPPSAGKNWHRKGDQSAHDQCLALQQFSGRAAEI